MMEHAAFVATAPGLEPFALRDVREVAGVVGEVRAGGVLFSAPLRKVLRVAYFSQSAYRVLLAPVFFRVAPVLDTSVSALAGAFDASVPDGMLGKEDTFKAVCERFGSHGFTSAQFAAAAGALVHRVLGMPVDIHAPRAVFCAILDGDAGVFGLDVCGRDLSKRYYKIFATPGALKGPIAYAMARLCETPRGGLFLDANCGPGMCPIELAIFASGQSVRTYEKDALLFSSLLAFSREKEGVFAPRRAADMSICAYDAFMPNVSAAKKNAKIAGVQKFIRFGRADVAWLDTKFDKGSVSSVVVHRPRADERFFAKLFYQLDFLLAPGGRVVVSGPEHLFSPAAAKFGFSVVQRLRLGRGVGLAIAVLARRT